MISFIGLTATVVAVASVVTTDHEKVTGEHEDEGNEQGNPLAEPE